MTLRSNLEDSILTHLQADIIGIPIEIYQSNILDIIERAMMHSVGLIVIGSADDWSNYESGGEFVPYLDVPIYMQVQVLTNDKRSKYGCYEYQEQVLDSLYDYEFEGQRVKIIRDKVESDRFPGPIEGVWRGLIVIKFETLFPFSYSLGT